MALSLPFPSLMLKLPNVDPATDFSSLIQGTKDAVLILSVRKPCRNDKCSDLSSLRACLHGGRVPRLTGLPG